MRRATAFPDRHAGHPIRRHPPPKGCLPIGPARGAPPRALPLPAAPGKDYVAGFNVHSIALQVPKAELLQGNEKTVVAGPEVKNFAQLKVADQVNVQFLESLVLELKKGSDAVVGRTEKSGGAKAPEGGFIGMFLE